MLSESIHTLCSESAKSWHTTLKVPALTLTVRDVNGAEVVTLHTHDGSKAAERLAPSSRFPIASLTKSFTAASILILRDRGQLDLDIPVCDVLPELKTEASSAWKDVSVRKLLSMQAGLPEDFYGSWAEQTMALSPRELSEVLAGSPISINTAEEAHKYSNLSYILLGKVYEAMNITLRMGMGSPVWQHRAVGE